MRPRRFHPPTWTAAIETVLYTLLCVAGRNPPITDEQDRILTDLYLLCDDLRTRKHPRAEETNAALAEKYVVSERTITNWRREGCPFEGGQPRVLGWVAKRRYAPAGTKAKFGRQLRRRKTRAFFKDGLAAIRTDILGLKARHRAHGLPVPDWTRGYFRAR